VSPGHFDRGQPTISRDQASKPADPLGLGRKPTEKERINPKVLVLALKQVLDSSNEARK
jgi:hypothetical protein